MSVFLLYLLTLLPKLGSFFMGLAITFISLSCVICFFHGLSLDYGEKFTTPKKAIKWFYLSILIAVLAVLMPSKSDLYFIAGGYYVTNNEEIKKLPDNVLGAVNSFLEEMKPEPKVEPTKSKEAKGV